MANRIVALDLSSFTLVERSFPETCKFCLKDECHTCQFGPERNALIQELQEEDERTIEKWERDG